MITTDIAFELWVIKPTSLTASNADMECVYRKKEDQINQVDFLHIYAPTSGSNLQNLNAIVSDNEIQNS